MKNTLLKTALCLCLILPACNNDKENTTSSSTAEAPVAATTEAPVATTTEASVATSQTSMPAAAQQQAKAISGTVIETMDSAGYTYMKVDTGTAQQWVAITATKVSVGDTVSYYDGMVMPNFTSKSLNKTFDSIIFSPGLVGKDAPAAAPQGMDSSMENDTPAAQADNNKTAEVDPFISAVQAEDPHATMKTQTMAESGGSVGAIVPFAEIKVDKAAGENAYTVAELFIDNTKLDGKTVRVQGKVVKFSPQIMGRNWIHLQDGSGDPLKNTHDLVVTTNLEPPKDQEIITIEGIVRAKKDFGAGYKYEVMIEEAKIVQ